MTTSAEGNGGELHVTKGGCLVVPLPGQQHRGVAAVFWSEPPFFPVHNLTSGNISLSFENVQLDVSINFPGLLANYFYSTFWLYVQRWHDI